MSEDIGRRTYIGITRGTLVKADDSKKLQELEVRDRFGETKTNVEHWTPHGHTYVPLPPKDGAEAETLVAYLGGSPDHPIVIATADRRHRPKNLKPGESARYDDQRQVSKIGRNGIETTGKKVTLTAGPKTETKNHELNEQLKGVAARVAQAEKNIHGLFDVTSTFREIVQAVIPGVAAVASILNKSPSGLDAMQASIEGKAQAYLQKQVEQALQRFLSPTLGSLTSLLSGGVEGLMANLKSQLESLVTANPVVSQVDDLKEELAALVGSGGDARSIATKTAELEGKIASLTGANPIIGQVAGLRWNLEGLIAQAGPAMNFLEPQKRLVQGLTNSVRFGGSD